MILVKRDKIEEKYLVLFLKFVTKKSFNLKLGLKKVIKGKVYKIVIIKLKFYYNYYVVIIIQITTF